MGVPNGSFEEDVDSDVVPDRWSVFFYPGGTGGYDIGKSVHGMKSYSSSIRAGRKIQFLDEIPP
jgi:hypothetical protein